MMALTVFAVLASIALPSYNYMVNKSRQSAQLSKFESTLSFLRSESVKRGVQTSICTSNTGVACDSSLDWNEGWIAFVDTNANGDRDTDEEILRINPILNSNISFTGSSSVSNIIRYQSNGTTLESGTITLCDSRGADDAKAIVLNATGKPKKSETANGGGVLTCP